MKDDGYDGFDGHDGGIGMMGKLISFFLIRFDATFSNF